jgi:hypothetical protein
MAKHDATIGKRDFFVPLTGADGRYVSVNVTLVRTIEPATPGNSRISFAKNHCIDVKGAPDMIAKALYQGE